jgi:hypothetical protein
MRLKIREAENIPTIKSLIEKYEEDLDLTEAERQTKSEKSHVVLWRASKGTNSM